MNINKTNYGAWFIDYFDGTLSAEKVAELFLFVEQHPELKNEFETFSPVVLSSDKTVFSDKEKLKRNIITPDNVEGYLIAELEDDLTLADKIKLNDFLKANPSFTKDRELFKMTRLQTITEVFPDKSSLRKKTIRPLISNIQVWTAIAAVLLVIMGILYINRPEDQNRTAVINPVEHKNNVDSLNDFFNKSDDIPSKINRENIAGINANIQNNQLGAIPSEKAIIRPEKVAALNEKRRNNTNNFTKTVTTEREFIQCTERIDIAPQFIAYDLIPVESPVLLIGSNQNDIAQNKNIILDKIYDINDFAAKKVNDATGEELLYSMENNQSPSAEKIPLKSRLIKLASWAIGKISNEKVKMETTFDQDGNLAAYQLNAGKLKYEKEF